MNKGLIWIGRITAWLPLILVVAMLTYIFRVNLAVETDPPSPEWSRSLVIDRTTNSGATVPVVMADGTLLAATSLDNGIVISRAKDGVTLPGTTTLPAHQPHGTSVVLGDRAEFFWLDDGQLYHAAVNADGSVALPPETITGGIKAAVPVRVGDALTVFTTGDSGVTAWTRGPEGWRVGETVGGTAVEALSARSNATTAYVAFFPAAGEMRKLQLAAWQGGHFQQPRVLQDVEFRKDKDSLDSIELALDPTWAYAFYVKRVTVKAGYEKQPFLVSAKLAGSDVLPPVDVRGGALGPGRSAGAPTAFSAMTGQPAVAHVTWVAAVSEAFRRSVVPVVATLKNGQIDSQVMAYKGYAGYRPAMAGVGDQRFVTFAVPVSGGWEIQAASTLTPWKTVLSARRAQDTEYAIGTTLLTTAQMFLPFIIGATVMATIFLVLLLFYFFALTWVERHGRLVFIIGLALGATSLLITVQIILEKAGDAIPGWLASGMMPYLVSLGVAALVLPNPILKMIRTKYNNPLATVTAWSLMALTMVSLLFGPFMAHS